MNLLKLLFNPDWFTFYMGGGGGPSQTTSYQTNIPEYARPYVEQMLGATQRQLFTGSTDAQGQFTPSGFQEYIPYGATFQTDAKGQPVRDLQGRVIYTNTAQQQAQQAVAPMSANQQIAGGAIAAYRAPGQTQAASQIAGDVAGRAAASGAYTPFNAALLRYDPTQTMRTESFTSPFTAQGYMSPYMQNVVQQQQREARRQSEIQASQNRAQAIGAGAFGGSRQAIIEAERQRNLGTQLGDIQGAGLQQAYQQGQQQFNQEQANYMAAQQANMQAVQKAREMEEMSRQYGANLGLQGYGQTLQAAQLLGAQGAQKFQQDMAKLQAQYDIGAKQQAQEQALINQQIQNYATAQQYPLMQLGVMSNMLRGLPMQASTSQMYQAQPSIFAQGAGAIGTGLGLMQQYNKAFPSGPGSKEGGVVKMAAGGIATGVPVGKLQSMVRSFSDEELQAKLQDEETDQATKDVMGADLARRQRLRAGMPKMAPGGIVAFKKGGKSKKELPPDGIDTSGEKDPTAGRGIQTDAPDVQGFTEKGVNPFGPTVPNAPAEVAPEVAASADVEKGMQDELARLKPIAERPLAEQVKQNQLAREQQGVPSPYASEIEQIRERKLKAKDEEKEAAQDRLINFLTRWGTLPGPTLVAMNRAGVEMIEKSELDRKDQRKLLAQLEESERQINRAEYSRKLGEEDRARQEIKEAGQMYFKVSQDLLKHKYDLAMKDADFRKAVAVAKAQSPKSDELGIQIMYEGLIAQNPEKYPPGPVTRMLAAQAWQSSKPGVVSTELGLGPRNVLAGAAASQAGTAAEDAETKRLREKREQQKDFRAAIFDAVNFNPENRAAIAQARKADAAAKRDITSEGSEEAKIMRRIEEGIRSEYPLLTPKKAASAPKTDTTPNPLADKKPEAKKDEKKKPLSAFDKT